MRSLVLALALGSTACAPLAPAVATGAQEAAAATEPVDVSELAAELRKGTDVPGFSIALWQAGELKAIGADGVRAKGEDAAVTTDDLWHLGSCTKAMTAALCAIAAERGLLSLDDTLGELLGARDVALHEAAAAIRLSQLLDHTSGLPANDSRLMARRLDDPRTLREARKDIARKLLADAPATAPGTEYLYSNLGYIVAGVVVEEVFDLDWEGVMRRELFEPLGMTRAGFGPPGSADVLDQPRGHVGSGRIRRALPPGPRADNPAVLGPAGTVHAPIEDWLRFLALFARSDPGDDSILSSASITRMGTPAEGRGYALGWSVTEREWARGKALNHAGSNTMWFALAWLAPERDLAVVAVANAGDTEAREACDRAIGTLVRRHAE